MELLSDPVHKWRTHLPELFPYMIGSAAGFLRGGESVIIRIRDLPGAFCLRICGADRGNASLPVERSGRQGRTGGNRIVSGVTFAAMIFLLFSLQTSQDCSGAGTRSVSVLRLCLCSVGDRSGDELFYTTDALRAVYTLFVEGIAHLRAGGVDSRNDRLRGDFCVSGQAGKPPA